MGRSYTPTYTVKASTGRGKIDTYIWDGRPTAKRLEAWRQSMNASFAYGGVNFHVSKALGVVLHYSHATIIRQRTGEVIAETHMPAFEVI